MSYKRFSTARSEPLPHFSEPTVPSIAESVSTVEIGKTDGNEIEKIEKAALTIEFASRKVRRAKGYGRVFRAFLLLSVLGLLIAPFTAGGKRAQDIACGLLTADEAVLRERIGEFVRTMSARERQENAVFDAFLSPSSDSEFSGISTNSEPSELSESSESTELSETLFLPNTTKNSLENADNAVLYNDDASADSSKTASVAESALINETAYSIDLGALSETPYPIPLLSSAEGADAVDVFGESSPSVLILHTHGTECYADAPNASNYRTDDTAQNVVAVGDALAEALSEEGISVLHCREMFDKDSFIKAYQNSARAARDYLSRYPSIRYIIDLHRDAVPDGDGYADLSTELFGEKCARLMLVIGTDEAGANHPDWQSNLRVAQAIQNSAEEKYPLLMRGINLRRASFNQQIASGYFLLEAGSCGGELSEAQKSVRLFAKAFADVIKE